MLAVFLPACSCLLLFKNLQVQSTLTFDRSACTEIFTCMQISPGQLDPPLTKKKYQTKLLIMSGVSLNIPLRPLKECELPALGRKLQVPLEALKLHIPRIRNTWEYDACYQQLVELMKDNLGVNAYPGYPQSMAILQPGIVSTRDYCMGLLRCVWLHLASLAALQQGAFVLLSVLRRKKKYVDKNLSKYIYHCAMQQAVVQWHVNYWYTASRESAKKKLKF